MSGSSGGSATPAIRLAEVLAGRLDPAGPGFEHLDHVGLGVAALQLGYTSAHQIAGQSAAHEDDEAVQARDAIPAKSERFDTELELLFLADGNFHGLGGYL